MCKIITNNVIIIYEFFQNRNILAYRYNNILGILDFLILFVNSNVPFE